MKKHKGHSAMLWFFAALLILPLSICAQEKYEPSLMYSTLLNGVTVDYKSGVFRMKDLQAVFLPDAESKTIYKYNPDDGGKLHGVIRKKEGEQVEVATFYAEKLKAVFWLMSSYKLQNSEPHNFKLPGEGEYVIDFYLEGKLFYRFPFRLAAVGGDDPYDPGKTWHLEGAWNDYGYLYYADADVSKTPMFKLWMTQQGKLQQGKDMKLDAKVIREADGKVVCKSATVSVSPKPWWIRYDLSFVDPENGQIFRAEQLLKQDGKHVVEVKRDGELYGTYPFKIKEGKIVYEGRAKRKGTPPIIFIEGGRDAWWIGRKEAAPENLDWLIKTAKKKLETAKAEEKEDASLAESEEKGKKKSVKDELEEEVGEIEKGTRKALKGFGKKLKNLSIDKKGERSN